MTADDRRAVSFVLPVDLIVRMRDYAWPLGLRLSDVARDAIAGYLDEHQVTEPPGA